MSLYPLSDSSSTMVFVSLRSKAKEDGGGGLEVKKLRFEKKTILDVSSNRRLYQHSLHLHNYYYTASCLQVHCCSVTKESGCP